jgi:type I restriction-modification system DNA methylase subunit
MVIGMKTKNNSLDNLFNLEDITPPTYFRSCEEIDRFAGKTPYSHLMRRAWETMALDGIFCIDRKPTVYFKTVQLIDPEEIKKLHRLLWNQGIATILVIISKHKVHVYSGLTYPAKEHEDITSDKHLVQLFDITTQALDLSQLIQRVETGQIYQDRSDCFQTGNNVDRFLLDNLAKTRDELVECTKTTDNRNIVYNRIHSLLGRLIFTCYLIDRKIINGVQFAAAGAPGICNIQDLLNTHEPEAAKAVLYTLFDLLQNHFNGSMFDANIAEEWLDITPEHVNILKKFLKGEESGTNQLTFDFWVYDFSVIPIETISAIYEDFLKAENSADQREKGAYYTPKHLAEMVIDVAVEGWDSLLGKRFLDPSCGSGIFLVILFNRLAEEWRRKNPQATNTERAKELLKIIQTHLCGVDVNLTACRITCFSLYLALLDQLNPKDIHDLKEKHGTVLTKLLALKNDNYATTELPVVYEGNFFDTDIPLSGLFDLVIGNPPWVGRNQEPDEIINAWCLNNKNPFSEIAPKRKADLQAFFQPQKQIAHAFMWKAPLHAKTNGRICLLLPAKVIFNKTDVFQTGWFKRFKVDTVIQLSDLRRILFENAINPAIIVKYNPEKPDNEDYFVNYDTPKASNDDPRRGIVTVFSDDRKKIALSEILAHSQSNEASLLWKKYFWATDRDNELLNRLLGISKLGDLLEKRWVGCQGFQPFIEKAYLESPKKYGKPKDAWWPEDHLYLNASTSTFDFALLQSDCELIGTRYKQLHRDRIEQIQIYSPPMVLANKGFTRMAFCDFPVIFQDAIYSISGTEQDRNLLVFLSLFLKSNLAKYFLFHTSSSLGIERDQIHPNEYKRLPFPLPESTNNPAKSESIINKAAEIFYNTKHQLENPFLDHETIIDRAHIELQPLVYDYYDISEYEQILVDDAVNISCKSVMPTYKKRPPTLSPPTSDQRLNYANLLCDTLNKWAHRGNLRVKAFCRFSSKLGLGILTLHKCNDLMPYEETSATEELQESLRRIKRSLREDCGHFSYIRDLKIFEQNELHLVKPLTLRHWTRTAALNDADEIAAAILSARRNA